MGGGVAVSQPMSIAVHHFTINGAQLNFGSPYLTYGLNPLPKSRHPHGVETETHLPFYRKGEISSKLDENSKNVVFAIMVQTCPFRENFHEHHRKVSVFAKIVHTFKISRTLARK
jgi:hypothetical protein